MKTLGFALAAVILIAAQLFTPVSAASTPAALAYEDCGETYVVQPLDYLAKIARNCGTSVSSILSLNTQITNANLIYTGQVLRLTSSAPITTWPVYTTPITYSWYARVSLSATYAHPGDAVTVYVSGFPAGAEIDYRVGIQGEAYTEIYDDTVSSTGTASETITLPASAEKGEYWVVQVITTSLSSVVSVTSHWIYITDPSTTITYTGSAGVSLSATRGVAGDDIVVYVKGFPANAEIDYRVGKQGADYSAIYDGTVGSDGTTSATIELPDGVAAGEYWVVQVLTTSLKTVTSVTSHTIYIYQ